MRTAIGTAYFPGIAPASLEALRAYLDTELRRVADAIALVASGHLDISTKAPPKPREGDLRMADGTHWNPGAGRGLYVFDAGAWKYLLSGVPGTLEAATLVKRIDSPLSVGGHRVLSINANGGIVYASSDDQSMAPRSVFGVTLGAAVAGGHVDVLIYGEIVESTWNFDVQLPIFLGSNGVMTQIPPASGWSIILGQPTSTNSMLFNPREPIVLAN